MIRVAFLLNVAHPMYIADFLEDGTVARTPEGQMIDSELSEDLLQMKFQETTVVLAIKHFLNESEVWDERSRLAKEHRVYESRIQILFLDPDRKPRKRSGRSLSE
ncbi:hypothetical protein [Peribacillus sp. SCS-155]|uniref:hypothetical protein n=1 Tax=Peribacillus sedimenti TaxID=3115297 RepID=UPI003906CB75